MSVYINLFVSSADEGIIFLIDGFYSLNLTPFYSVSQPLKLKYRSESFTLKELWVSKFNSSKASRKLAISYLAQSALLSVFCKSYLIYLNFLNTFSWKSTSARKFSYSYNPHLQFIDKYLTHIGKGLDSLSSKYDKYSWMSGFNAELSNYFVDFFCDSYSLKSLIKKATCFKKPDNPTT